MRIIAGKYKHRHFSIPSSFRARPTTDFAKENLFNVLAKYIDFDSGECTALDLFAGTGSISLELASRGVKSVTAIEQDRRHYAFIRKCVETIGTDVIRPICTDVFRYLKTARMPSTFVFADPPYDLPTLDTLPHLILDNALAPKLFVLEHGKTHSFTTHPAFIEERVYGSVHFSIFIPNEA